ncbi:MAG TPA: N-acetylmuramidase domain-containing protein [Blastocatellia bacterium]|nr:N-acetylmuramidase domain-containing protein [Blastocatellia bacterium]
MTDTFIGTGFPLDADGQQAVLDVIGVGAPELWSVLSVETKGFGYLNDRRPQILYERHIFSKRTNHKFDQTNPDISNTSPGGYGATGGHQYDRLQAAIALNRQAALESASWGIGQLMGFNCGQAGFDNVESMVAAMMASENDQLLAMGKWIVANNLNKPLVARNWAAFAKGYNGANYAINQYDKKLAAAYARYSSGKLPDLSVRQAQVYLTYLGLNAGGIDGLAGPTTYKAVNAFQAANNLPVQNQIDDDLISNLKNAIYGLAASAPQ